MLLASAAACAAAVAVALLVALALLWDPAANTRRQTPARAAFLLAGGLSCPTIILTGPLFGLRALMQRQLREWCYLQLAPGDYQRLTQSSILDRFVAVKR